jgi:transposase-like protein
MAGKITGKSQKGNETPEMTEGEARAYIERLLWPNGEPVCRHCGSVNAYRMQGKTCRPGLCRCRDCKKQFTVTVGTIFEDSHLPLSLWVKAIHQIASSKKGMSALQLQRNLGIGSYRTAWFLAHRIRLAMRCNPVAGLLKGDVRDETYVGANRHGKMRGAKTPSKRGRGTSKTPVLALVESKPGGKAYAQPIERVDGKTLKGAMEERIDPAARIVTDELNAYPPAVKGFTGGHETVCHSREEYVNERGFHTNTVEAYFALLKRGVIGTFHHVSRKHLHRYCDEFSFRWGERLVTDAERREQAIKQVEGKRLMYRQPVEVLPVS